MSPAVSLELLREFVSHTAFVDAIRVASPALHHALANWLAGRGKLDAERLEQSLIRYFGRATYRTTPFGLFAGCSLMTIGDTTRLDVCQRSAYSRRSRLDMDYVAELSRVIMTDGNTRQDLPLYSNSSATLVGGRLHYVEASYHGRTRQYALTAVEPTPEMLDVLSRAESGAAYGSLFDSLSKIGFEDDEVKEFLNELLDAQLLVPGVEPQLTGSESATVLANDLSSAGHGPAISDALRSVIAELERIDAKGVGCSPEWYDTALEPLSALPVTVDPSKVLQVDLFKPSPELCLGSNVIDDAVEAAEILTALSLRVDRLAAFVVRFEERYETLEVPLLEALDDEVGIGFPDVDANDRVMRRFGDRMRQRDSWLGELRGRVSGNRGGVVELETQDLERARSSETLPLSDAVSVLATLMAESSEHVNRGEYQLLVHHLAGPSGARMLGRFAHLHPDLERRLQEYVRAEEAMHPDVTYAEIVHLPQGRIGNISARPVLRDYEITYMGRGGGDRTRQLRALDLAVSVRSGRIVLRSKSLDREIQPRLSCAHNYTSARELPVYRFLASLQDHNVIGSCSWSWGIHASTAYLPRVSRSRLVLSRATWNVTASDIKSFTEGSKHEQHDAFERWRDKWAVPQYAVFAEGDNRLPIDCGNPCSVESLRRLIRGRRTAVLEEMLPAPDSLCVRGPEGRFTNEIVIPLIREPSTPPSAPSLSPLRSTSAHVRAAAVAATRRFPPGQEWVYAKLYCGRGSSDFVLRTVVTPLVATLDDEALINKWFFLRYSDPDTHIRLRFQGQSDSPARVMQLLSAACAPAVANGRVSRLVFDTYLPEVERYGGARSISLAESMFHCDSMAALDVLSKVHEQDFSGTSGRDMIAAAGIDRYFTDAKLALSERITLLERMLGNPAAPIRRARSVTFRARRSDVDQAVYQSRATLEKSWLTETLDQRSIRSAEVFCELRKLESQDELIGTTDDMVFSFTHMWLNRLMPSNQEVELMLHDFLHRHYLSELARTSASSVPREGPPAIDG